MNVQDPVTDFPRIERAAQESRDEHLIAYVATLQKVIVTPTTEQQIETIETAAQVLNDYVLYSVSRNDPHYRFFNYWERKLTKVLYNLGKAVTTPGWEHEILHQHLALKDTLLEMVMTYR